jgi:hypothetical protein
MAKPSTLTAEDFNHYMFLFTSAVFLALCVAAIGLFVAAIMVLG